jgi:hypothetical protein
MNDTARPDTPAPGESCPVCGHPFKAHPRNTYGFEFFGGKEYCGLLPRLSAPARLTAQQAEPAATNMKVSVEPPICQKHGTPMTLTFYERPGGPPGNGWSCQQCAAERAEPAARKKT